MKKLTIVLALIIVLGGVAAYLYFQRYSGLVIVNSSPPQATVSIDDKTAGETLLFKRLFVGKHTVRVYKPGYGSVIREIDLKPKQELRLDVKLPVMISTNPPGAELYIDGEFIGKTPQPVHIKAGAHNFRFVKEGYQEYKTTVVAVTEYLKPIPPIDLVPIPPTHPLTITTDPPAAEVYLNSEHRGQTPITLHLEADKYDIEIVKRGYRPYKRSLTIPNEKRLDLKLQRVAKYGSISVTVLPYGDVYLDGMRRGQAPILIRRVPEGEHTLTVKRKGYQDIIKRVEIEGTGQVKIEIGSDEWIREE